MRRIRNVDHREVHSGLDETLRRSFHRLLPSRDRVHLPGPRRILGNRQLQHVDRRFVHRIFEHVLDAPTQRGLISSAGTAGASTSSDLVFRARQQRYALEPGGSELARDALEALRFGRVPGTALGEFDRRTVSVAAHMRKPDRLAVQLDHEPARAGLRCPRTRSSSALNIP